MILNFSEEDLWIMENVEYYTLVATNSTHIVLSRHLLRFWTVHVNIRCLVMSVDVCVECCVVVMCVSSVHARNDT